MSEGLGISGAKSWLNISAATVLDGTTASSYVSRRISRVNVLTAGTTLGSINDCLSIAGASASNLVASIPNVVGPLLLDFPCFLGIVVTPGTGQVVSVSYD